ncbi:hypothetical protein HPB51_018442 [Rhipicephalus microplus]|uniref:CCHC-type domain-containing protein n=1 Tax=Rhipicephalus microplus TaxID=6941 RepID=A0A9J6EII8_RHIMP|nr:hypothetical protein HPB51_018442 [Rhipicephalus microplus]
MSASFSLLDSRRTWWIVGGAWMKAERRAGSLARVWLRHVPVLILACEPLAYDIKPSPPTESSVALLAGYNRWRRGWDRLHRTTGADPVSNDSWKAKGKIVREELTRHARPTPYEPTPAPPPSRPSVSIVAAGNDDCNYRPPSRPKSQRNNYPLPRYEDRFSYPHQPANTYYDPNEDVRVPPPRQRNAFQEYNAYRQAPVCYRCGITGNIAQFCRRQREPTSRYRSPSEFPPAGTGHNNGHWFAYSRSTSRWGNHRGSSPASGRSLTPPSGRLHRSPSPGRRLSSPPPPGN